MGVFDKELTINGKAVRSPEQQVYKNMKDIEALQEIIKKMYKTSEALTNASTSVAIADTNAPEGTEEGWLITDDGLLFSITGGDDTNLLLSYYSDLKGPEGPAGAALNIDDDIVSLNKVWSSSKTKEYADSLIDDTTTDNGKTWSSSKIDSLLSNGIAYTYTLPIDSTLYLTDIYIGGTAVSSLGSGEPKLKVEDNIIYVDSNDRAKVLYRVTSLDDQSATLTKICDFPQGTTLYQHNIFITKSNNTYMSFTIINNDSTVLTLSSITSYVYLKGLTSNKKLLMAQGFKYNTNSSDFSNNVVGVYSENGTTLKAHCKTGYTGTNVDLNISSPDELVDTVFQL